MKYSQYDVKYRSINQSIYFLLHFCRIHASRLVTRDFGDEAARWVGRYLNDDKLRLVYYLESNNRLTMDSGNNRDSNIRVSPEDKVSSPGHGIVTT